MRNIEVIDYKESWSQDFESEKLQIEEAVGSLSPTIHHIGSTSVKNLAAKPIIDILVEVDALEDLELFNENLEEIGYVAKGENGITGRRYYEKGGDDRSHQIHAFLRNSRHSIRHLAFRDYLKSHKAIADAYAVLKKSIAESCNNDIERYCDTKMSLCNTMRN